MDETGSLGKNGRTDQKESALFNVATALRILGDTSITSMQKSTPDLSSNGCPDSSNKVKSSAQDGPQGTKQGRNQKGGVSGGRPKKVASRCGNHNDDVPMTFPQKLNEILEDKANENIITWLPHGKAFIIYYKKRFAAEIMPRYFKESKYTSFTRKLNRWGFTRVSRGPESGAYYHKCFQKGNHLLRMQMFCQSGTKPKEEQEVPHPQHSLAEIRNATSSHQHSQVSSPIAACTPGGMLPTPPPPSMATATSMATAGAGAVVPQSHSIPTPSHDTVDLVSQHMRLLEMTRSRQLRTGGAPTAANSAAFANTQTLPNENFSSAVINAAVEALQRSNEVSTSGGAECGLMKMAPKPMPMLSGSTFQQQIDQYKKHGIMDPSMMQAIVRQQAAAEVMARAQRDRVAASSARLEQLQKSRKSYSKSAHAA